MANVFNPAGADRQDFTDLFANLDYLDLAYVAEAGGIRAIAEYLATQIASVRADLSVHYVTTETLSLLEQRVAALEGRMSSAEEAIDDLRDRVSALEGG